MASLSQICKLCLGNCKNFEIIDENAKNLLNILVQKIEWTIIQEPVMCINCAELLKKCYDFKAICLNTRDLIVPFANNKDNVKLDLKDVYLYKNATGISVPEDQDICGFCMNLVRHFSVVSLDVEEGNVMLQMIQQCLPELDFSVIKKPVICVSCHGSLEDYFHFVTNSLIVEEKIKKCCETMDINSKDQITLKDLLKFTLKDVTTNEKNSIDIELEKQFCEKRQKLNASEISNGDEKIKVEQMSFDEANKEVEAKNESFMETNDQKINNEHQVTPMNMWDHREGCDELRFIKEEEIFCEENEYHVKMEDLKGLVNDEIEIKTDEHESGRLEDGVSSQVGVTSGLNKRCSLPDFQGNLSKSYIKHTAIKTSTKNNQHKDYLKRHLLTHKDPSEVMYKCDDCSYQTNDRGNIKKHVLIHKDPTEVTMYKCADCSYQTIQKSNLKTHSLIHKDSSEVTMYKCDACSYQTRRKHYLKSHMLKHKDPSEVAMYKCDSCTFQTKHKYAFSRHLLVHKSPSEAIIYNCESCTYQTNHKDNLKAHLLTHKDPSDVIYKCDGCSYQTNRRHNLKNHLLTHKDPSEVTMYKCDDCSYQTKDRFNLKRHSLIHKDSSEVTMYKCDACSYQTKRKQYLKIHLLKHKDPSEVTMYKCDDCSYQTNQKGNLKNHSGTHKDSAEMTARM